MNDHERPMRGDGGGQGRNPGAIRGRFNELAPQLQYQWAAHSRPVRSSKPVATLKFWSA